MYSKNEELIDFQFNRDMKAKKFDVEYLVASTKNVTTFDLNTDKSYITIPLHHKWAYVFKLDDKFNLYYFSILKEELDSKEFTSIQFNVIFTDEDRCIKQLRKMLDRAEFNDDTKANDVLFNSLKNKLIN